jgi:hypothetical protein
MNKINGIQSNYHIYKNEGNPYSQQEVIWGYVDKFKNET